MNNTLGIVNTQSSRAKKYMVTNEECVCDEIKFENYNKFDWGRTQSKVERDKDAFANFEKNKSDLIRTTNVETSSRNIRTMGRRGSRSAERRYSLQSPMDKSF